MYIGDVQGIFPKKLRNRKGENNGKKIKIKDYSSRRIE